METVSILDAAWDASLARLSTTQGPSSITLAESLRRIDTFFTPAQTEQCAWRQGHSQVQEYLVAVVSHGHQHTAAKTYLNACERNFAATVLPTLDSLTPHLHASSLEIVLEQAFLELHTLRQAWRTPLQLDALGSGNHLTEFDTLFARLLRAHLSQAHLAVISELMRRLVDRIAQRPAIQPGSFIPSTPIWIDLGLADIAFTSLVIACHTHLRQRIKSLAAADISHLNSNELADAQLQNLLQEGQLTIRVLPAIHSWLRHSYGPILQDWLLYLSQHEHKARPFGGNMQGILGGLHLAAIETLSSVRSKQMFDIIMDFPVSQPAMMDLKDCLHLPDSREHVIVDLSSSIRQRLLHPGAQTSGIILTYLRTVSTLRLIDESGVILSRTAPALRRYLRSRQDIVSAIVTALVGTDPEFESLREELRKDSSSQGGAAAIRRRKGKEPIKPGGLPPGAPFSAAAQHGHHPPLLRGGSADDDGEGDAEEYGHFDPEAWKNPNWQPRPVDAGPNFNAATAGDIVNMLVSIFDEEAHFVAALERSTATELIKVKGYAPDKEYHNNLILKKRFGEAKLARCDVMLNDFPSSRRIDHNVHERIAVERRRGRGVGNGGQAGQVGQQPVEGPSSSTTATAGAWPAPGADGGVPTSKAQVDATIDALHPLIVSRQFWPPLEDGLRHEPSQGADPSSASASITGPTAAPGSASDPSTSSSNRPKLGLMKMPGQLGAALAEYSRVFAAVKSTRRVLWLGGLGSVDVEIEMEDGRVIERLGCSPAQAAVVEVAAARADDGLPVTTDELVIQLEADKAVVTAALQFWVGQGVLREVGEGGVPPGTYVVVERADEGKQQ